MANTVSRAGAGLVAFAALFALSGCNDDKSSQGAATSGPTTSATSPAPTTSSASPSASESAEETVAPLPTVTESQSPSTEPTAAAGARATSEDGVFSVEIPTGYTQNATSDAKLSSITLNAPDGGNLQILSLRYSKPQQTITAEFSRQRDAIVQAFPNCKFPAGANVIRESLGGGTDANYRIFKCDSMPFANVIFTANGPKGELLAGHQAYFGTDGEQWKQVVRSVVTAKR